MFLTLSFNPDDIIPVLRSMQNELIILGIALALSQEFPIVSFLESLTNSDFHNIIAEAVYTVAEDIVYDETNPRSADVDVEFAFAENLEQFTYLSRAGGFANYDAAEVQNPGCPLGIPCFPGRPSFGREAFSLCRCEYRGTLCWHL